MNLFIKCLPVAKSSRFTYNLHKRPFLKPLTELCNECRGHCSPTLLLNISISICWWNLKYILKCSGNMSIASQCVFFMTVNMTVSRHLATWLTSLGYDVRHSGQTRKGADCAAGSWHHRGHCVDNPPAVQTLQACSEICHQGAQAAGMSAEHSGHWK